MQEDKIMLEYNESQGCFHNNIYDNKTGWDHPLFSNGWKPICIIPWRYAVSAKDDGFSEIISDCTTNKLSFETVYEKVVSFILKNS